MLLQQKDSLWKTFNAVNAFQFERLMQRIEVFGSYDSKEECFLVLLKIGESIALNLVRYSHIATKKKKVSLSGTGLLVCLARRMIHGYSQSLTARPRRRELIKNNLWMPIERCFSSSSLWVSNLSASNWLSKNQQDYQSMSIAHVDRAFWWNLFSFAGVNQSDWFFRLRMSSYDPEFDLKFQF